MVYHWDVVPSECLELYSRGYTICEIAALIGSSKSTVARRLGTCLEYVPTRVHSRNRPKLPPWDPGDPLSPCNGR